MSAIELVVLDMAGTTIEDRGQVREAFVHALQQQGISLDEPGLAALRGASKREVARTFVSSHFGPEDPANDRRVEQVYADFCTRLESSFRRDGVHTLPGTEQALGWLRERGIRIALTTGFPRRLAGSILDEVGWEGGQIDCSVCSDEVPMGRPAPYMIFRAMEGTNVRDVRRVIKVGDTMLDLRAGVNAGCRGVVGVLSGSHSAEQLGSVSHTHLIPGVGALPVLMQREFLLR